LAFWIKMRVQSMSKRERERESGRKEEREVEKDSQSKGRATSSKKEREEERGGGKGASPRLIAPSRFQFSLLFLFFSRSLCTFSLPFLLFGLFPPSPPLPPPPPFTPLGRFEATDNLGAFLRGDGEGGVPQTCLLLRFPLRYNSPSEAAVAAAKLLWLWKRRYGKETTATTLSLRPAEEKKEEEEDGPTRSVIGESNRRQRRRKKEQQRKENEPRLRAWQLPKGKQTLPEKKKEERRGREE
jgi:hypothetical protein